MVEISSGFYVTWDGTSGDNTHTAVTSQPINFNGLARITGSAYLGAGALTLPGSASFANVQSSGLMAIASGPFTLAGWWRFNANSPALQALVTKWDPINNWAFYLENRRLLFRLSASGNRDSTSVGFFPNTSTWYHLAVDRDSAGNLRMYVDGVMVSKTTSYQWAPNAANISSSQIRFGRISAAFATYDGNHYVDDAFFIVGSAYFESDSGFAKPTLTFSAGLWPTSSDPGSSDPGSSGLQAFSTSRLFPVNRGVRRYPSTDLRSFPLD
jgi:hypothetical protein